MLRFISRSTIQRILALYVIAGSIIFVTQVIHSRSDIHLRVFSTNQVGKIDLARFANECNLDFAYDGRDVHQKGKRPLTWQVLKQAELALPLTRRGVIGATAEGRWFIISTFGYYDGPGEYGHYEITECTNQNATLFGLRMLQNPALPSQVMMQVIVNDH